ncbi:GAF domain-containing sensor histidine kinase [Geodermatophilus maliterrae]|uniref:GAF domain-containing protein n=1 Tax=Geodermatophilus maliterrae TaxID=3162531 RepID=A0ABV3XIN7_9ACTN
MTPPGPEGAPTAGEPALAAAVRAAAAGGRLEATLHGIVEAAVGAVDATYGALGVLTPDGRQLDRFVIVGLDESDPARIGQLPEGAGVLGLMVDHPAPLRLDDLGTHAGSVGFPLGHPPMHSLLGVPVCVRDAVFGHLYLTGKRTGGPFTDADEEAVLALAGAAGLAIENARLAESAERRRAWVQAATEVSTALLSGAEPDAVLATMVTRVAALSDADRAGVLVAQEGDAGALTIVAAAGPAAQDLEGVRVPLEHTHVGRVHRSGVGELVEDINDNPVLDRHAAVAVELIRDYRSAVIVPLGPSLGTIVCLRARDREPFDTEDLDALSAFAAQAAVALELARSQRRERRLQVQADRDRIARDLHDHVVQRLYATALALDRVGRALEDVDPYTAQRVERSVDELDATIAQIRSSIFGLRDGESAPAGLGRRLADVVRLGTEGSGVRPDLRLRGDLDGLPPTLTADLLAVVRELVSNVVRHAGATRVAVTVDVGEDPGAGVCLVVADDGRGLPAVTVRSGLANLAERAAWHGGRMSTVGGPAGTEVTWTVPRPRG